MTIGRDLINNNFSKIIKDIEYILRTRNVRRSKETVKMIEKKIKTINESKLLEGDKVVYSAMKEALDYTCGCGETKENLDKIKRIMFAINMKI